MNQLLRNRRGRFSLVGATVALVLVVGAVVWLRGHPAGLFTPQEADPYVRFTMEAYDTINQNYWIKPGSFGQFNTPELPQLFQLAVQKEGLSATLATSTRSGTAALLSDAFALATSTEAKKQMALQTLTLVLYNLPPVGRGSLLSQSQVTALRQDVANINPGNNLYEHLGVSKSASLSQIEQAYSQKSAELARATSTAAKAEIEKVVYARNVLTDSAKKQLYDSAQIEPSVFAHTLGRTLYLSFNKISPTTLQEFGRAVDAASTTPGLDSMILDMRGNVGGALDFTQAFVGLFIGSNQYAYDLYHQGETQPQRTTVSQFPELARYRELAVLTDAMTQSTAELTTATLKRLRLAKVVGTRTRGWGSVENTYPLKTIIDPSTSYALLLVNSLTLRDDQEPVEQNGVLPNVDTSVPGWRAKLSDFFDSPSLLAALRDSAASPPLR